jgi:Putative zinc- or iron-chelating domain
MTVRLPVLPPMRCDDGCGACCTLVVATRAEYAAVVALARQKGLTPRSDGLACPFYQEGRCSVYEARPAICRMFGHTERLVCERGYNVNVPQAVENRIMKTGPGAPLGRASLRKPYIVLHQALVDFGIEGNLRDALGDHAIAFLRATNIVIAGL